MSNSATKKREPLFHIIKRPAIPMWQSLLIRAGAILAALIVAGVITYFFTGLNPISVYTTMIEGAIGTEKRIWNLLQGIALLLCVSLAVTPAFKMKFWNIGAEGQALMGGLASALCMILLSDKLSGGMLMLVMIVTSIVLGAVWALLPAIFKAKWNTNETLFTLMMNYIAMQIVSYFSYKYSVPKGSGSIGIINSSSKLGWFPSILDQKYLLNIIIVTVLTVLLYVYLKHSKHGYEISVVGESENTAKYIGINVKKVIIRTMLLSGAICGIAGLLMVAGTDHTIATGTVGGRGFTAIMVSWLAKFNPIMMFLTSFLIVFLEKGAIAISSEFDLNSSFSDIITGIIIFFIIGSEFFINYSIKFRESEKEGKNK
ncbi:MAG: ABC transporter permease [Clostridia bacterium]|nr:ABC transporter permease [Clostridia bacterium]